MLLTCFNWFIYLFVCMIWFKNFFQTWRPYYNLVIAHYSTKNNAQIILKNFFRYFFCFCILDRKLNEAYETILNGDSLWNDSIPQQPKRQAPKAPNSPVTPSPSKGSTRRKSTKRYSAPPPPGLVLYFLFILEYITA